MCFSCITSLNFPNNPRRRVVSLTLQMKELRHKVRLLARGRQDLNSNFPRETPYLGSGQGGWGSQAGVGVPECRVSGFGEPLVVPHPFSTVLSCVRGLGGGLGLEYLQEAGTLGEVDTKLRVAEEQKKAGEPDPKEKGPAGSRSTTSLEALQAARQLQAPVARANCAELLPRGGFGARVPATAP